MSNDNKGKEVMILRGRKKLEGGRGSRKCCNYIFILDKFIQKWEKVLKNYKQQDTIDLKVRC